MARSNKLLCLTLEVKGKDISLNKLTTIRGTLPAGGVNPKIPVSDKIIGHWIDILSEQGEALHRCFIHNKLPFNSRCKVRENALFESQGYPHCEKIMLLLPHIPEATELVLYEQSYPSQTQKQLHRKQHLRISFEEADTQLCGT